MSPESAWVGLMLVGSSVLAKVAAQVVLKSRLNTHGAVPFALGALLVYLKGALTDRRVLGGGLLLATAGVLWFLGLSRLPLSIAFPVGALAYPMILATSVVFLDEEWSGRLLAGNLLIVMGVVVLGAGL